MIPGSPDLAYPGWPGFDSLIKLRLLKLRSELDNTWVAAQNSVQEVYSKGLVQGVGSSCWSSEVD